MGGPKALGLLPRLVPSIAKASHSRQALQQRVQKSAPEIRGISVAARAPGGLQVGKGVAMTLTVTLLFAGGYAWHRDEAVELRQQYVSPHRSFTEPRLAEPSASPRPVDESAAPGRRDVYGNDITDAVATYTLDPAGSVYEEHSPQTEVPQLDPPTT